MSARILHVVRSLRRETGGLAEAVRHLAAGQRQRGLAVTIASLDPADTDGAAGMVFGRRSEGYGYAPDFVPWLRAHRHEFSAVIVHGLWQYQGLGTWRALRGTPTPYLVYCHGMLDGWFKRAHPWKHAKKWLYWPWADYRVLRDAAAVCFTAEAERDGARGSFGLYRARERIAPLGIASPPGEADRQRTAFFARQPRLRDQRFVLFLGRLHPKKGVDLLLRGYADLRAVTTGVGAGELPPLVIAGPCADEVYRQELHEEAKQLGLADVVTWLPMLTGEEKWGALRACEAFVLPSHQENFGVAVVEALACGRPVLMSDRVNIWREIVADGAGLAAPDTRAGARELLARWITMSAAQRADMTGASQRCYERRFTVTAAVNALQAIVAEAVNDR